MPHPVKIDDETFKKIEEIHEKTGWSYTYIVKRVFEGIDVNKIIKSDYRIVVTIERIS